MRNFKSIIKCVVFLLLCAAMFVVCDFLFMPSGYIRVILHTLNHSEENFDTVVLGASHGRSAIDPAKIDEQFGSNAINISIPNEKVKDSYYLLKESCRNNDVKTVIMDLDYQYWFKLGDNDFADTFIYSYMEPSSVKLEYFRDNLINKDFRLSFVEWARYSAQYSRIKKNVATKQTDEYQDYDISAAEVGDANGPYVDKGFFYRKDGGHEGRGKITRVQWNDSCADPKVLGYFNQIVNYCKENNIRLICVTSPITPATALAGASEQSGAFFTRLAQQYGIEYYDFNLLKYDVLPRVNTDFGDWEGHMCGKLAEPYSTILGQVITEAQNGTLDADSYFYKDYDELKKDTNSVLYLETDVNQTKNEDGTYTISFEMNDTICGSEVSPQYRVSIKEMVSDNSDDEVNVVSTEYDGKTKYTFTIPAGNYRLRVYAKDINATDDQEYCEKILKLQ